MTPFTSTLATAGRTPAHSRGRARLAGLWITQLAVAGMMMLAGGLKLAGAPEMVGLFDAIGVGQWFRYVTGGIEVGAALALLVPSLAAFGAALLVPTMIGAIATHLFIVGGSSLVPTMLLAASLAIAWTRRKQLVRALPQRH